MHFCLHVKVLIFLISYFNAANGNFAENLLDLMLKKRLVRGISEKAVFDFLEKYVEAVDIESFAGDYYLVQFLDYNSGIISFHHVDPLRQIYPVYSVECDIKTSVKKDVFVLHKNEDRIKVTKDKKTYVVLRRVKPDSTMFYISYIYVKEPHDPPTSNTKEIGGENYELEWDLWDHRGGKEYKSQLFGHTDCKATIFVPCKTEETKNFAPTTFSEIGQNDPKKQAHEVLNFATGKILLPHIGDDVNADIDFFYDLDDDLSDARYVGEKILNLTKSKLNKMQGRVIDTSKDPKSKDFSQKMGKGIVGSFVNLGANIADTFMKIGVGFVKNFNGLFGGLGTKVATLKGVASSVNIEGEDGAERWMEDSEMEDLLAELRQDTSGGLGGMISTKEKGPEINDAQFQAARGILDFLPENEKDPMPNNVVEEVVNAALNDFIDSSHPGWKTMGVKIEPNVTLALENQAFFGFSPCNFPEVTPDKIKKAKSPEKLVELVLQVVRTHCIKESPVMISNLFAEGFVVSNGQNAFQISPDLKLLNQDKLSTSATLQLLQGFEFAVFSDVYYKEASSPAETFAAPDGSQLSHSVFLIGNYVKTAILTYRQSSIRVHCIKIRRNLVKTLKSFLLKLIQDKIILQKCDQCKHDRKINYNDSVYIMGLIQFIFRGLSLSRHGEDFEESFNKFYTINKLIFEGKVKSYYI